MKRLIETAGWIALGIIIAGLITSSLQPAVTDFLNAIASQIASAKP